MFMGFTLTWVSKLQECLGNMERSDHPYEGYAGYMMSQAAYVLYSTTPRMDLNDMGNYFILPTTAITNTKQKYEDRKWQSGEDLLDTFPNMWTTLCQLFERTIDPT